MRCEAVAINADFWSQVLQAATLKPPDFALGAVMLTRRTLLAETGGFPALANCLADDYQLGHRLARNGHRIVLSPVVVDCWNAPMNWRGVWKHQLRWARTIRTCRPAAVFFQHPGQRHPVAVAVAGRVAVCIQNLLRSVRCRRVFADPDGPCPEPSAPVDTGSQPGFAVLAGAGEGLVAGGGLGRSVPGKHHRMARTNNAFAPGRNAGGRKLARLRSSSQIVGMPLACRIAACGATWPKAGLPSVARREAESEGWWALRDSNPRPTRCKRDALATAPSARPKGSCQNNPRLTSSAAAKSRRSSSTRLRKASDPARRRGIPTALPR